MPINSTVINNGLDNLNFFRRANDVPKINIDYSISIIDTDIEIHRGKFYNICDIENLTYKPKKNNVCLSCSYASWTINEVIDEDKFKYIPLCFCQYLHQTSYSYDIAKVSCYPRLTKELITLFREN
jgi:hypothetical protein